jgi:hypothetical protein
MFAGRLAVRWALALALPALAACKGHSAQPASAVAEPAQAPAAEAVEGGAVAADLGDGGETRAPSNTLKIAALASPTPISNAPEWPAHDPTKATDERVGVIRLGYLRKGAVVDVKPEIIKRQSCLEGWYELVAGGYVCGKYATADLSSKELEKSPHPPFTDRPLPYDYGLNLTNGTPLYRRAPLRRERKELEQGLAVGKTKKKKNDDGTTSPDPAPAPDPGTATGGDKPWYLQDHHGQRPLVKFDELKGESTLIELRMVRGFYLALDKEVHAFAGKFWLTTLGSYAPADHILVHKSTTEFEGVDFSNPEEKRQLPLAFVLGLHAHQYNVDQDNKKAHRLEHEDRFTITGLTGKKAVIDDHMFLETDQGWWLREIDATFTRPGPPPSDLAPGEKWVDVNITTQTLVAFEGDKPVYATLVSSGRHNDEDKSKDHKTITGTFSIREKHIAATMEDDGASDGPYSIQDVPWIMYFHGSYALHGAFWHSSFGHERSHGCVNMTPFDAKKLFAWSGPHLPDGWHGVRATAANPGTRIVVHE